MPHVPSKSSAVTTTGGSGGGDGGAMGSGGSSGGGGEGGEGGSSGGAGGTSLTWGATGRRRSVRHPRDVPRLARVASTHSTVRGGAPPCVGALGASGPAPLVRTVRRGLVREARTRSAEAPGRLDA